MSGAGAPGLIGGALPGAARAPSALGASGDAWERLADERPDAAFALQALFAALLSDAQHDGMPAGVLAHAPIDTPIDTLIDAGAAASLLSADTILPPGGEYLPDELPDLIAGLPDAAAVSGAGSGAAGEARGSASTAALVELIARGPQAQGEAAYQSWARELLHRTETLMRTADEGAVALPAEMEALPLPLRPEQGAYGIGTPIGVPIDAPGQAAAATAVLAAMLRNAGEPGTRGEALPHADAAGGSEQASALPAAATAQAQLLPASAGERALPAWSLSAPLQHPQWGEEVSERVRWMLGQQLQSAELKITPPELGTIEVRISVHKDQMSVSFAAPNAAVREALEDAMPRLREMLSGSGYESVSVDISQHSLPQRRDTAPDGYAAAGGRAADGDDEAVVGVTTLRPAGALGVIDFYA